MEQTKFEQYATLKARMKDIEEELKAIEKDIMPVVEEMGGKNQTVYGTFFLSSSVVYEYNDKIKSAEAKVKQMKEIAKAKGQVSKIEKPKFVFTPAKMVIVPSVKKNTSYKLKN